MKRKANNITTVILILMLIAGLSLLLYPTVSNYWNSFHSSRAISTYAEDEVLTYEVDKISIVEPSQVSELQIVEGEDLCTLVTCTPYGINTHRLLVRGHRIENIQNSAAIRVTSDALQIDPLIVAPIAAAPILLVLLVLLLLPKRQYPSHGGNKDENI